MKTLKKIYLTVVLLAVTLAFQATSAMSDSPLLIQSPTPFNFSTVRPQSFSWGLLAIVEVGASNVAIDQIGTFGQVSTAQDVKWLIFGNVSGSAPLLQIGPVFLSAGSQQWLDSPVFSPFSLLANTTYWIGVAANGPTSSLRLFANNPGTLTSANGLTLPIGNNGNITGTFASPTLNTLGNVQTSMRLFGSIIVDVDTDGDGIADALDNCPAGANPGQEDLDGDSLGDVCDADDDSDGVNDVVDNCPIDANPLQEDFDFDGLGNACDATFDGSAVVSAIETSVLDMVDIIVEVNPPGGNGMISKLTGKGRVLQKVGNAVDAFDAGMIDTATYLLQLQVALTELTAFDNQLTAKIGNGQIPEVTEGSELRDLSEVIRSAINNLITDVGG